MQRLNYQSAFYQFNDVKYIKKHKILVTLNPSPRLFLCPLCKSWRYHQYICHKFTIGQIMHVSCHKTQKTFMNYINISSDEIADEIDAIVKGAKEEVF